MDHLSSPIAIIIVYSLQRFRTARKKLADVNPVGEPRNKRFLRGCNCEWFPALFVFRPHEPPRRPFNEARLVGLGWHRVENLVSLKKKKKENRYLCSRHYFFTRNLPAFRVIIYKDVRFDSLTW